MPLTVLSDQRRGAADVAGRHVARDGLGHAPGSGVAVTDATSPLTVSARTSPCTLGTMTSPEMVLTATAAPAGTVTT